VGPQVKQFRIARACADQVNRARRGPCTIEFPLNGAVGIVIAPVERQRRDRPVEDVFPEPLAGIDGVETFLGDRTPAVRKTGKPSECRGQHAFDPAAHPARENRRCAARRYRDQYGRAVDDGGDLEAAQGGIVDDIDRNIAPPGFP